MERECRDSFENFYFQEGDTHDLDTMPVVMSEGLQGPKGFGGARGRLLGDH
jgi:hypothetical protein